MLRQQIPDTHSSLKEAPQKNLAWDERLQLMIVDHCTVYQDGSLQFTFKDGIDISIDP